MTIDLSNVSCDAPTFIKASKLDIELAAIDAGIEVRVTCVGNGCLVQEVRREYRGWFYINLALFIGLWTLAIYAISKVWGL